MFAATIRIVRNNVNNIITRTKKMSAAQAEAMKETLFLVDNDDNIIGKASKEQCHKIGDDGEAPPLHRAFSVFLFNKHGDLLLQKRAAEKVTYPNCYTNSCCSHPIADIPGEDNEEDAMGIKRAAQRRLSIELGIPINKIQLDKLNYLTRIYYKDEGDGKWGEHEIDYILFLQDNLSINPNPSEISEISYVPRSELDEFLPTLNARLTPWFSLILKHRLRLWWDNLDDLDQFKDHKHILKLSDTKS